ncbi:MAG: hypothetical protein WB561_20590 [Terracidiphilus sp.]
MTESTILLLACLAVIALMAFLIYVSNSSRSSAVATLGEIRRALDQILAGGHRVEDTLAKQRRVLNDAHKKIHAVSEGFRKRPS